jgi:thioester reductase-like protein
MPGVRPVKKKVFFTGFPGFIGRELVRQMLRTDQDLDFVFLVQDRYVPDAVRQADRIRACADNPRARLQVLAGDITDPYLGLKDKKYETLASEITDVFHLAALYDLAAPEETARSVNVDGTRHVLSLCRKARKLRTLVYFSSVIVSGKRTGTVLEDELQMGQRFHNHYESTKHEAEILVRDAWNDIPTVIIRPSIVVGHSETGETNKFDGPYFAMVLIDTLRHLQMPLPYVGDLMGEFNIIPVDFLVKAAAALWMKKDAAGACFHVADSNPVITRTLYAELIRLLGARGPFLTIPPAMMDLPLRLRAARRFLGVPREFFEYLGHKVHYDTTNTTRALEAEGIACPYLLDYLPRLVDFYKANKHRRELRWKAF